LRGGRVEEDPHLPRHDCSVTASDKNVSPGAENLSADGKFDGGAAEGGVGADAAQKVADHKDIDPPGVSSSHLRFRGGSDGSDGRVVAVIYPPLKCRERTSNKWQVDGAM
jgi:hypothetical protein